MKLTDLLAALDNAFVVLSRGDAGTLDLEALFPDTHPLPPALVEECRRRKPELLEYLAFAAKADAILLTSTSRIAAAWPQGCDLDGDAWQALEELLTQAYRATDLPKVKVVIEEREALALDIFTSYRKEHV